MTQFLVNCVLGVMLWIPVLALAAEGTYTLTIKDHRFDPPELTVPANQKIKIIIDNQDSSPEEFESHDLNREKIIPANSKGTVLVGPLKPGTYKFVGEFHEDTAQGALIVQ